MCIDSHQKRQGELELFSTAEFDSDAPRTERMVGHDLQQCPPFLADNAIFINHVYAKHNFD